MAGRGEKEEQNREEYLQEWEVGFGLIGLTSKSDWPVFCNGRKVSFSVWLFVEGRLEEDG